MGDEATFNAKAKSLGVGSALMIVSGYYGELTVTGDLTPRWICWFISMAFFLYIVQELLVGLSEATELETNREVKDKIKTAQVGYCASDIISKCGVGLFIYQISYAKSKQEA